MPLGAPRWAPSCVPVIVSLRLWCLCSAAGRAPGGVFNSNRCERTPAMGHLADNYVSTIVKAHSLTGTMVAVLRAVARYSPNDGRPCFAGNDKLAAHAGTSVRTAVTRIHDASAAGHVTVERMCRSAGRGRLTDTIRIVGWNDNADAVAGWQPRPTCKRGATNMQTSAPPTCKRQPAIYREPESEPHSRRARWDDVLDVVERRSPDHARAVRLLLRPVLERVARFDAADAVAALAALADDALGHTDDVLRAASRAIWSNRTVATPPAIREALTKAVARERCQAPDGTAGVVATVHLMVRRGDVSWRDWLATMAPGQVAAAEAAGRISVSKRWPSSAGARLLSIDQPTETAG